METTCKLLILTTVHQYNDARIFYKEAVTLRKEFSDVTIMAPHESKNIFQKNRIKIIPLPVQSSRLKRVIFLQYKLLLNLRKSKYKVIHFHDPELILLAYILKSFYQKKIIFDVHEDVIASIDIRTWIPSLIKPTVKKIYSYCERILIKKFDELIIAEKSYREIYGKKPVEILNYPVIENNFSQFTQKDFSGHIKFIYGGNITLARGIWPILKSFKVIAEKLDNCSLHLAGKIEDDNLSYSINEFINNNNLETKIKIYGRLSVDELYLLINECHIGYALLKPINHHTGKLPGKIFDYMNFGLPVVASNFTIYHEYISKKNTGILVDYFDVNDIASQLIELLTDRKKLTEMSQNSYSEARSKWTWKTQEEKLLNIYRKL